MNIQNQISPPNILNSLIQRKEYRIIPVPIWREVMMNSGISVEARFLWSVLWELCSLDTKFSKHLSWKFLSKRVGKSESSIRRWARQLQDTGYLKIEYRFRNDGSQLPSVFTIGIPAKDAEKVHKEYPDRKVKTDSGSKNNFWCSVLDSVQDVFPEQLSGAESVFQENAEENLQGLECEPSDQKVGAVQNFPENSDKASSQESVSGFSVDGVKKNNPQKIPTKLEQRIKKISAKKFSEKSDSAPEFGTQAKAEKGGAEKSVDATENRCRAPKIGVILEGSESDSVSDSQSDTFGKGSICSQVKRYLVASGFCGGVVLDASERLEGAFCLIGFWFG